MTSVTIEEAQARLPELISEMQSGHKIVITRDQQPVAELRPLQSGNPNPAFGSCKGKLTIISEDEEHLHDFKDYMP
jgi:antitoxin (DNA-binding transcriptional repressor) of toxin-antitoxin stability system